VTRNRQAAFHNETALLRLDKLMKPIGLLMTSLILWAAASQAAEPVFPAASWQPKRPGELGLSTDALQAIAAALGGRGCVIKDGYVVHQWGDQTTKGDWLSSAKPVISTLLFFAVHEGKVKSVDTPIAEFGWDLMPKDRTMTFRHLANMTSGYARPEEPGQAWAYNDFAIQLYQKTLFDRIYREDPDAVANSPARLGALGLEDGLSFTADRRRLRASVRDFSRIAWFWLNRGKWQDRQLLPARYFDDFMRPQTPKDLPVSRAADTSDYLQIGTYGGGSEHFTRFGAGIYGFNWWFNETGREHPNERTWPDAPPDTVMSIGARGNCSVLMPALQVLVVGAQADWGQLEAGRRDSVLNQRLKLIASIVAQQQQKPK
jgi:CubicO group peptidase (beta-lactamase class C family)